MNVFKMPGGQAGHVLTSDASGAGTWQPSAGATFDPQDAFRFWIEWKPPWLSPPLTCDQYDHYITGICISLISTTLAPDLAPINLHFHKTGGTHVISLASTTGGFSWSSGGGAPIVIKAGDQLMVRNILGGVHITITGYHQ